MSEYPDNPRLSVIIPAYNEEPRLAPSLQTIYDYLRDRSYGYEIIVVSDGSRDRTVGVAEDWRPSGCPLRVIDRKENRGKGYTVREGGELARGDYVLFSDADLSTPIEEVEKFWPHFREGYDVVIGSRNLKESRLEIHQPFYREIMGRVFNALVRFIAVGGIKDTQCGFKCFTRDALSSVIPLCRIDGFSFDVEMLFITRKLGHRIKEVPVRWLNAPGSTVSPVRDSLLMFLDVCRIRLNDWRGRYSG